MYMCFQRLKWRGEHRASIGAFGVAEEPCGLYPSKKHPTPTYHTHVHHQHYVMDQVRHSDWFASATQIYPLKKNEQMRTLTLNVWPIWIFYFCTWAFLTLEPQTVLRSETRTPGNEGVLIWLVTSHVGDWLWVESNMSRVKSKHLHVSVDPVDPALIAKWSFCGLLNSTKHTQAYNWYFLSVTYHLCCANSIWLLTYTHVPTHTWYFCAGIDMNMETETWLCKEIIKHPSTWIYMTLSLEELYQSVFWILS